MIQPFKQWHNRIFILWVMPLALLISSCCKNLSPEYNSNTFRSRDYHVVNTVNVGIYNCNKQNLHLATDSLQLDSMIKDGLFDTAIATKNTLKSIDFNTYSFVVGFAYYYGNYSTHNCFVNHVEKKITIPVRSSSNCVATNLARQSKLIAILIPRVSKDFQFTQ